MDWRAHTLERLDQEGFRRGGARAAVVELLAGQECCLSAQEIHEQLRAAGTRVGVASVYRVLELLSSLKLVRKVDVGGGVARYERSDPGGEHHHHIVCDRCGKVVIFVDDPLEAAVEHVARRLDYELGGHEVVLRGACAACAKARRRAVAA